MATAAVAAADLDRMLVDSESMVVAAAADLDRLLAD